MTDGPADECGHLTAFSYSGLVSDNKGLPLLHLVDCHSYGIHLLCSKGVVHGLNGIVTKFRGYKFVNALSVLGFNLGEGCIHRFHHCGGGNGLQAECG